MVHRAQHVGGSLLLTAARNSGSWSRHGRARQGPPRRPAARLTTPPPGAPIPPHGLGRVARAVVLGLVFRAIF